MNKENLYELLDIETPDDFQYFENFSDLIECGENIDYDILFELINGVDKDVLSGLIDSYFEEITDFIPQDETDIYSIFENVRRSLTGLARNITEDSQVSLLTEEIDRFRKFYTVDSTVYVNKQNGEKEVVSICDAIYLERIGKLNSNKYEFDFSESREYPIDEYIMSFGDLITLSEREDDIDKAQEEIERNVLGQL